MLTVYNNFQILTIVSLTFILSHKKITGTVLNSIIVNNGVILITLISFYKFVVFQFCRIKLVE